MKLVGFHPANRRAYERNMYRGNIFALGPRANYQKAKATYRTGVAHADRG